ncbi:MAG: SelB C-terminal domain-containing protein, partial [Planctomycetota bacterium]
VRTAPGRVTPALLDAALEHLVATGRLAKEGRDGLRLATHASSLSDEDRRDLERVRERLAAGRGQPPAVEDLEADLRLSRPRVMRALKLLANRGEAFQAGELFFDGAWVQDAQARLAALAKEEGGFTPANARTLLHSTRKWVIPLLEAFDRAGFSRRVGNKRVVR